MSSQKYDTHVAFTPDEARLVAAALRNAALDLADPDDAGELVDLARRITGAIPAKEAS